MSRLFENQTVFITGASAGFGLETARSFAKEGARLILLARRKDKLKELAQELKQLYETEVLCLGVDVSNFQEVEKAINSLPKSFAAPDILINNAGGVRGMAKLWEVTPHDWNAMIDINIKGILNIIHCVLPHMIKQNKGHVINVGSISGHDTYPGGGVYCATKFAVRAMTNTLRMELVSTPIRVSLISPGMAETEFSLVRFNGDKTRADKVYEGVEPLKAEDIAEAIIFMASRPSHVNIADLVLYPKAQASTTLVHRKT